MAVLLNGVNFSDKLLLEILKENIIYKRNKSYLMSYNTFSMASDDERFPDYNEDSRSNIYEQNAYDSEEG